MMTKERTESDDKILAACKALDRAFEALKEAGEGMTGALITEERLVLLVEAKALVFEALGKAEDALFTP